MGYEKFTTSKGSDIRYKVGDGNCRVVDSYLISDDGEKREFLALLAERHPEFAARSVTSYVREWAAHNILYGKGVARDHTKDVDLNVGEPWWRRFGYWVVSALHKQPKWDFRFNESHAKLSPNEPLRRYQFIFQDEYNNLLEIGMYDTLEDAIGDINLSLEIYNTSVTLEQLQQAERNSPFGGGMDIELYERDGDADEDDDGSDYGNLIYIRGFVRGIRRIEDGAEG